MSSKSPFSGVRFEHESKHLYYIPPVFSKLEVQRPVVLVGNRGTGKTTLLRALNWRERLDNESLLSNMGEDPFEGKYIGLYLKLPEVQLRLVDSWLNGSLATLQHGVFSAYLDSVWLQLATEAVSGLIAREIVDVSPQIEAEVIAAIAEDLGDYRAFSDLPELNTLRHLERCMRAIQVTVERAALRGDDPRVLVEYLPTDIGLLGRRVTEHLVRILELSNGGSVSADSPQWRFQVCFDEAEVLSVEQQQVTNTMIRMSTASALPVMSYVSLPDNLTSTVIPSLTLQRADFDLIQLGDISPVDFKNFVQGVSGVRLSQHSGVPFAPLDLDSVLGSYLLNPLIADLLARSEKDERVVEIYRSAVEYQSLISGEPGNYSAKVTRGHYPDTLPYWEAYALTRGGLERSVGLRKLSRRESSASLRKIRVPAFLAMHLELGSKPRYAGADVVLALSDGCVRDYLWQMDSMTTHLGVSADGVLQFLNHVRNGKRVPRTRQDAALQYASQAKAERIKDWLVESPELGEQLVHGLATLTKLLQQNRDPAVPLDLEAGLFKFTPGRPEDWAEETSVAATLIRDAVEAGYLRLKVDETHWQFRVHSSISPVYGLSWRKPLRVCRLSARDIMSFTVPHEGGVEGAARAIARRVRPELNGNENMLDLDLPL